jgi:hypothetical protein
MQYDIQKNKCKASGTVIEDTVIQCPSFKAVFDTPIAHGTDPSQNCNNCGYYDDVTEQCFVTADHTIKHNMLCHLWCPQQNLQTSIRVINDGKKYDTSKPRWDLLPLELIEKTVDVLTFGAKKYGPNNWQSVDNANERYYAALMRHITAWRKGELNDPETGISHLAHATCNLLFLYELNSPYI